MRCFGSIAVTRVLGVLLAAVLLPELPTVAAADQPAASPEVELLTNLVQLRRCAAQVPSVVHPFRIVADVLAVDPTSGVLVLRDSSEVEFVQLDLRGQEVEPGAKVLLEGNGCGVALKGFGLAIVRGMVVDNDGLHGMTTVSGMAVLHAGLNSIQVQWFNRLGDSGLKLEYEGPGLPRQPMPASVLSRARIEPRDGVTNFPPGLNYACYEGGWWHLPDFAKREPVRTGVATNFDLAVQTRRDNVGLQFDGFITIPRDGTYRFYLTSDDGSRLCVGESLLDVRVVSKGPVLPRIEQLPATTAERKSRPWVILEGTLIFGGANANGGRLQMRVGNHEIRVDVFACEQSAPQLVPGAKIRVGGIYEDIVAEDGSRVPGILLCPGWSAVHPLPPSNPRPAVAKSEAAMDNQPMVAAPSTATGGLVISSVADVKTLSPEQASSQLPVSVRGVVTATLPRFLQGVVIQDSTKGIFVSVQDVRDSKPLVCGEFCQVDGVSGPGLFAPIIVARRITHLGAGQFPEPVHPTREQLMNGSLDTQYAELEGVVTSVHEQQIVLLTESGEVNLDLSDFQSEALTEYENALVRIRGCVLAMFDEQTHKLEPESLRVIGGTVDVVKAAPPDLFDAPRKNLGELWLYDPVAAPLRRLKISGQVVYRDARQYFLSDGANGIRVTTRGSGSLVVGDLVDAVGFLELGGPAAELKDAVMRKTGHAALPAPTRLTPEHLLQARYAGTLVRVDATLMNQWREALDRVLELQSGFVAFRARIYDRAQSVSLPPSGSRLELTGVYAPEGKGAGIGSVSGFDLLLNSPTGIRVLATPPWWTLRRVLILVGVLIALLGAVLIWNRELHRKVEERGRQLETEIGHRQRAELQHAAEAERSRIARDLHDELGAGLTEVSLLASTGLGESREAQKKNDLFRVIGEKARALVSGLDVIVWAIDPRRNSLQSFADYVGRYATEVFSASGIVCRFKIPIQCKAVSLTEAARHSLFLAVKEALNNVIRHSAATEVKLQMAQKDDCLEIVIADNGHGVNWDSARRGNGMTNLDERLKALHGQFHIETHAGNGTTVRFTVPLPRDPEKSSHDTTSP